MELSLIKGHGSGNDFLIINEILNEVHLTESDRAKLAQLLCNRETELGADGILFVMSSERADGRMRVFNADGSEASMCGNGLRLVARSICELYGKNEAIIETMKKDLKVRKQEELYPNVHTYQVEISPVLFELKALPLNLNKTTLYNETIKELSSDLKFTALAVPNPHLISIVDSGVLMSDVQQTISEKVNGPNHLFPDGVNVSFVKPIQSNTIYVRTYERGVGFTNACGTAMSASSLVTCLQGINEFEKMIDVYNNGGRVQCIVHKDGEKYYIDLIGNATYLYEASVKVDLEQMSFSVTSKKEFTEQDAYEKLQAEAKQFLNETIKG
ncbi:diaminopimelate epimerase [Neobacillus sedimentimangrovi]|uniref:diaminopimelate epimerase n=1 Tax=Neobacillus sedimentimangrovi TaxID=2699460 RepID=UPI0013D55B42|nr:diaminopimelate epimerase [Neobacillus sedimentimangrovi]